MSTIFKQHVGRFSSIDWGNISTDMWEGNDGVFIEIPKPPKFVHQKFDSKKHMNDFLKSQYEYNQAYRRFVNLSNEQLNDLGVDIGSLNDINRHKFRK